jgi:hypothetical protein
MFGFCKKETQPQNLEAVRSKIREEAKDHILLMLGAPVIKIELDATQIDHAIRYAEELIDCFGFSGYDHFSFLLKEGSLAYAKYMLGRIRVKYINTAPSPDDGFALVNEGRRAIHHFLYDLL